MKKVATFPISAERGVLTTPNARPVELIAPKPLAILLSQPSVSNLSASEALGRSAGVPTAGGRAA